MSCHSSTWPKITFVKSSVPASILLKSISDRYRHDKSPVVPITVRYRFDKKLSIMWLGLDHCLQIYEAFAQWYSLCSVKHFRKLVCPLLKFVFVHALVVSYVTFVLSLFVPHISFFRGTCGSWLWHFLGIFHLYIWYSNSCRTTRSGFLQWNTLN